jgi:signal recognition particle GTPase
MDKQFLEDYKRNKESIERYMPKEVIARLLGKQDEALKYKYNRILKQHTELGENLNAGKYTGMKMDEAIKSYQKMGRELDGIIKELRDMDVVVSDTQIEYGF